MRFIAITPLLVSWAISLGGLAVVPAVGQIELIGLDGAA